MAKKIFPKVSFKRVTEMHIGLLRTDDPAGYFRRISTDKHDDTTHKFKSSDMIPGICAVCGWIHKALMCNESNCDVSIRDHARFVAVASSTSMNVIVIAVG